MTLESLVLWTLKGKSAPLIALSPSQSIADLDQIRCNDQVTFFVTMADDHNTFDSENPLILLQSKDHEEILNVIDQLRLDGISRYVDLPQLIVCGDQSSGKSSVLEAISGLGFPAKDNLCTRFATELILRRGTHSGVTVSIHPDEDRSDTDKIRMREFKSSTVALAQFKDIVSDAERVIGVGTEQLQFSKDVLRVEVSGPNQPHLTMVDLPGLYHAPDDSQDEAGVEFVSSLVLSYIQNPRSVILAVVSAKSDIALQKVTAFTRKADPNRTRTLGLITKPDTLVPTSDMETSFIELARNRRVEFRLGWHVLKNRDHDQRHLSLDQRRDAEFDFLRSGVWASLDSSQIGIDALRPRLSSILKDHIVQQLPSLIAETQKSHQDAIDGLRRMGDARQTTAEQRRYLLHASSKFTALLDHAISGTYSDTIFGDAMEDQGYHRRLRAVMQNELSDFSEMLSKRGEKWRIVDDDDDHIDERSIKRSDFVDEVQQRLRRSRGRELPGMFNPLIVGDLFYLQAQPWAGFVDTYIDNILVSVQRAIALLVQDILDERTSNAVLAQLLYPQLEKLEAALRSKTQELLSPQQSGHPITYNHYFTEIVQGIRQDHLKRHIKEKMREYFGANYPSRPSQEELFRLNMDDLIRTLSIQTEANMERFACSEAIDYMQAYYKVSPHGDGCAGSLTLCRWHERSSLTTLATSQSKSVSLSP